MKYLKSFNESDAVLKRISGRIEQAEKSIPEFITKMSEVINTNYEIYDIDEELIMYTFHKYLFGNKRKDKIEYKDLFSSPNTDNTGRIVSMLLNFGYSIAYFKESDLGNEIDIDFSDFIGDMFKCLHFDRISDNKLTYDGPVVLSSSITASSFGTKEQIDRMDDMVERYYNDDKEVGEISVLIGCIYQYGYGLGNDVGYIENMKVLGDMNLFLSRLNKMKNK